MASYKIGVLSQNQPVSIMYIITLNINEKLYLLLLD